MGREKRSEALIDRALGHRSLTTVATALSPAPLRILAYHEIRDVDGFCRQMEHLTSRYHPVGSSDVIGWLEGGELPTRAVWVTFDDGDPTVVELGLPVLERHRVPATMFVCPGLVDTNRPFWWQVVEQFDPREVARLKMVPDDVRAARTEEIALRLQERDGRPFTRAQLSSSQLDRWLDTGRDLGNHTWDHPLLDRCSPEEQSRQIRMAHEWLDRRVGGGQLLFAYPNGNTSAAADSVLEELGYRVAVLFDHRIARSAEGARLSRLRTNADGDTARFRAVVSGVHPLVHHALGRR